MATRLRHCGTQTLVVRAPERRTIAARQKKNPGRRVASGVREAAERTANGPLRFRAYGAPCACPGSSRRPAPGRPAAEFTDAEVVGPTQNSAASVGSD